VGARAGPVARAERRALPRVRRSGAASLAGTARAVPMARLGRQDQRAVRDPGLRP